MMHFVSNRGVFLRVPVELKPRQLEKFRSTLPWLGSGADSARELAIMGYGASQN